MIRYAAAGSVHGHNVDVVPSSGDKEEKLRQFILRGVTVVLGFRVYIIYELYRDSGKMEATVLGLGLHG